eukprot:RCo034536
MFRVAQREQSASEGDGEGPPPALHSGVVIVKGPVALFRDRAAVLHGGVPDPQRIPRSELLCLLAPSYLTPEDILRLLEPFQEMVSGTVRICVEPGHSLAAVFQLVSTEAVEKFYSRHHLRPFSPAHHEFLLVLFLDRVDFGPASVPLPRLADSVQLPTCHLCLERLESSISGQLSTMCD